MISDEDRRLARDFIENVGEQDLMDVATREIRNAAEIGYFESKTKPDGIVSAFYRVHAEHLGYSLEYFSLHKESGTWRARITGRGVQLIIPDPTKIVYGNGPEDAARESF